LPLTVWIQMVMNKPHPAAGLEPHHVGECAALDHQA